MRKLTHQITLSAFFALGLVQSALASISEGADDAKGQLPDTTLAGGGGFFSKITNVLIYLVGAIAVIVIIIGGLRYVISQGSSDQVKQAKDTILYGVIGLVVAILAYALVHFVIGSLT